MGTLNIATWNATDIMSSASYASDLLLNENVHILRLSEHWLYRHNLHFLQAINSNYNCFDICDHGVDNPSNRKVGKGDVAILWNRSLDNLHHWI